MAPITKPISEASLRQRFDVISSQVTIAGRELELIHPRSADDLISEEDFDIDERLPYWAELWPSSQILAEKIAADDGRGRRCLELGCGLGLVSLIAAVAGYQVLATDYYAEALEFLTLNSQRNRLPMPGMRIVDWRRFPDDLGTFDLVLAADVLYERPNAALVATAIKRTLESGGRALISDPGRPPARDFPSVCQKHGLEIVSHTKTPCPGLSAPVTIDVYELRHDGDL